MRGVEMMLAQQMDFVFGTDALSLKLRERQDRLYESRWRRIYTEERKYPEYVDMGGES